MALQPEDAGARVSGGRASSGTADAARVRVEAGRAEILARHRSGAGGQEVVRSISALTDEVVQQMFAGSCGELPGAAPPRVALIATGGYGRRELSPRSDVDLLALLPPEDAPAPDRARADAVAERLHRALWDAGLEAGFAARTLRQTLRLAREKHTSRAALLDCRLVCADTALIKDLERGMVTELEARKVEGFIQEKLEEPQVRRKRYGGSIWLLEPHLKQGKGGLRDLQAALWIARVRHKVAGLGEAGERGLLPAREVKEARAARDLLWRLRNELHYATGRRDDRLTFDNQRRAAAALGYRDSPTELGVEQLMRQTYIALQEIAAASQADRQRLPALARPGHRARPRGLRPPPRRPGADVRGRGDLRGPGVQLRARPPGAGAAASRAGARQRPRGALRALAVPGARGQRRPRAGAAPRARRPGRPLSRGGPAPGARAAQPVPRLHRRHAHRVRAAAADASAGRRTRRRRARADAHRARPAAPAGADARAALP